MALLSAHCLQGDRVSTWSWKVGARQQFPLFFPFVPAT